MGHRGAGYGGRGTEGQLWDHPVLPGKGNGTVQGTEANVFPSLGPGTLGVRQGQETGKLGGSAVGTQGRADRRDAARASTRVRCRGVTLRECVLPALRLRAVFSRCLGDIAATVLRDAIGSSVCDVTAMSACGGRAGRGRPCSVHGRGRDCVGQVWAGGGAADAVGGGRAWGAGQGAPTLVCVWRSLAAGRCGGRRLASRGHALVLRAWASSATKAGRRW